MVTVTIGITYVSTPAEDLGPRDVQNIWITSLQRNRPIDVSGVLYFGGDFFLHVLEGEEDVVEPLFRVICRDPRHCDVKTIAINDLAAAMFRNMPMKFINGKHSPVLRQRFVKEDLLEGGRAAADRAAFQLLRI